MVCSFTLPGSELSPQAKAGDKIESRIIELSSLSSSLEVHECKVLYIDVTDGFHVSTLFFLLPFSLSPRHLDPCPSRYIHMQNGRPSPVVRDLISSRRSYAVRRSWPPRIPTGQIQLNAHFQLSRIPYSVGFRIFHLYDSRAPSDAH